MLKSYSVRLDDSLIEKLKNEAKDNNITVTEVFKRKLSKSLVEEPIRNKSDIQIEQIENIPKEIIDKMDKIEEINRLIRAMFAQLFSNDTRKNDIVVDKITLDDIASGKYIFLDLLEFDWKGVNYYDERKGDENYDE